MTKAYRTRHSGPAIVAGAAPSVFADVERVTRLFPSAPLYGANSAGALFPDRIEHIWTQHASCAPDIKRTASVYVHARSRTFQHRHLVETLTDEQYAALDYEWPELDFIQSGTSGTVAAIWARRLGHSPVIVCGVALDPASNVYAEGYPWPLRGMAGTVWQDPRGDTFDVWHQEVRDLAAAGHFDGVKAASGWLVEALGGLE
jgi:hypothetical protein